ncbi:MAG: DUF4416 family protein [Pirellulales bacterium]|nr:DUF4416 family protein [Pirellulales bacterium]
MGQPSEHSPVLLLMAAFSRHDEALDWAADRAVGLWGARALESPRFEFDNTDYYRQTMGDGLRKVFWTFKRPFDPAELPQVKLITNQWEDEYAAEAGWPESRPLNLDPGYLTLSKLVLASTKDFAHRIYLNRGIFAEITLYYRHGRWQDHPFTFADYKREDYQQFFTECRDYLHRQRCEEKAE